MVLRVLLLAVVGISITIIAGEVSGAEFKIKLSPVGVDDDKDGDGISDAAEAQLLQAFAPIFYTDKKYNGPTAEVGCPISVRNFRTLTKEVQDHGQRLQFKKPEDRWQPGW